MHNEFNTLQTGIQAIRCAAYPKVNKELDKNCWMWCYTTQSLIIGMDRQHMEQDENNINMFKDSKALLATSSSSGKTPMLPCEFCSIEAGLVQNFLLVPFKQIGSVGDVRFGMQQSWNGYWVSVYIHTVHSCLPSSFPSNRHPRHSLVLHWCDNDILLNAAISFIQSVLFD